jgi:CubicO group peptidase (beta-lactamase class C family)
LGSLKKIILAGLLSVIASYNPGAVENPVNSTDKIVPGNIRLTNSFSSGAEFEGCDMIMGSFMKKWTIAGASVAISKDGKLVYAKGFGFADTSAGIETQPYN